MEINQITKKTKGEKEKELEDLRDALESIKDEIDGLVSGAIASKYQKSRIDKICKDLELKSFAPSWDKNPEKLLREEIKAGFEIIFTGVYAEGFCIDWLGRKIDEKCIEDLTKLNKNYGINICGEGGEFETLVVDCPIFKKKIKINNFEKIWDDKTSSGYIKTRNVELIKK